MFKRFLTVAVALLFIFPNKVHASSDYELLCKVVMSEAEAEPEIGQRLVVDSILNRVESDEFPNTIKEVINQPNQFYISNKEPSIEIKHLVLQEMHKVTNQDVLYFRTNKYHNFGQPLFEVGHHYFSGR